MVDDEGSAKLPDHERYGRLVTDGRVDELLREVTEAQVAQAWARYHNRYVATTNPPDDDPDWWAVHLWMDSEWFTDERRVREGILRLFDLAATDAVLEFIGISIMEGDFFTEVQSRVDWVEARALESARFRRVLANLRLSDVGEEVLERLERAAGKPLARPRPREEWSPEARRLHDATVRLAAAAADSEWGGGELTPERQAAAEELLTASQEMREAMKPFSPPPNDADPEDAN